MKHKWAVGLDLGGTNARLALVDRKAGIAESVRRPSKDVGSPKEFVKWAAAETDSLLKRHGIKRGDFAGVGVGVPGPVHPSEGRILLLPNIPSWKNVPLRDLLSVRAHYPVTVENDGNAMTMAEFRFGAARGARNTLFITLGTGIGCGIVLDKKLFHGSTFSAAEISHIRFGETRGSALCGCGSRGCIETRMGNRPLLQRAQKELAPFSRVLSGIIGKDASGGLKLEHVTQAARAGDRRAVRFWAGVGEEFGDFLGGICNLLNPEMIVIGGGVAGAGKYLFEPLRGSVRRHAFRLATDKLRIVPATYGADAGVIGAAALAFARSEDSE